MLVLERSLHDRVFILLPDGQRIEVHVCEIRRGLVKLGFVADASIKILREEIIDRE